jgi:undecaprenyl-diphosphatase
MRTKNIVISIALTVLSVCYTLLVKFIDVDAIGPNESEVGFSKLNGWFSNLVGSNMTIYKITEVLGLLVIAIVLIYGCIGIYQLVKRKNLLKVDREIIVLGCFYVLMAITYVLFEKVVINYRPILIDGELEASYPSSHTILALCIALSSLKVSKEYFNKKYIKKINIITIVLMSLVVIGRLISGVHWISDIIGGIIISLTLLSYFNIIYDWNKKVS